MPDFSKAIYPRTLHAEEHVEFVLPDAVDIVPRNCMDIYRV